ncbi:TM2 domain protein [Treponema primitia ZAS-2]|uniref:TM2 domain protein n=1 Tax=Treponema primitia (strain ATCC BAA-887 / DSM 12427 / ZAS-2) TaxID=545694 RepID=F5YIF8_TREPZ|nr:NINE protein [Treponema primitia]AEF86797.1 TM2 domain protein [Treponema primitia ZAS-2]
MYSTGLAYLLWLVSGFGALGFHRFYLGKIPTGLLWMCTGGLGMVGSIYDFFTLPGQVREANLRDALFGRPSRSIHGGQNWRTVSDGQARIVREKETVERTILRLAKQNKGILTASEVALEANISMDDAKKVLDTLVNKGFAELRVRQSGTLVYTLPELMDSDSPLEDF